MVSPGFGVDQVGEHVLDDRGIGRMGVLGRLERAGRARGEQGEDDVVGPVGQARIAVRRPLGQRQQVGPDRAVAEADDARGRAAPP